MGESTGEALGEALFSESSRRKPGSMSTSLRKQSRVVFMGPGLRRGDSELPRGVVAELVLAELEADEHLEVRPLDRRAHGRIGHRVDGGLRVAGAALAGDLAADVLGQGGRRAQHLRGGGAGGAGPILAVLEAQADPADALGDDVAVALNDGGEIGKHDLAHAAIVAALAADLEACAGDDILAGLVAG